MNKSPENRPEIHLVVCNPTTVSLNLSDDPDIIACENLKRIWCEFRDAKIASGEKITQKEFANSINWTQGTFSGYMNGSTPIGFKPLMTLCQALGCEPADIRPELESKSKAIEIKRLEKELSKCMSMMKKFQEMH